MKNLIKMFLAIAAMIIISSCKSQVDEKPFEFNGESFETIVRNAISGDENSKNILDGLFTFDTKLKTFNKIDVDSIEINNINYYTLLLENQNPVYNLFAVVDKNMNLILKDESLNGYLKLNFKKSGSRRFAVVTENFNSKDVIELNRVSYYLLEQYSSDLVFRQFIKIKTPSKEAEQVISVISDTAIITSIFYPAAKNSKTSKDVFRFDVATDRYLSANNLFDSLVVKEIRSLNIQTKNPQITDGESILRFFNNGQNVSDLGNVKLSEKDFVIDLDSTWKKLGSVTISNLVKQKVTGSKYISGKMGASISLAAIAPTDSAENYFNETLNNKYQYNSSMRSSDKLIDNKNIYQLYEFSCPTKKILMILETPKSTYELNKNHYEEIIKTFLVRC
ncbi:MAG TPA: hypothetical protein PLH53_16150 [Ignavibacteriaceae bacterium]|nr:hypothetical protein [Ignavibacteriaceae bacterium]